MKSGNDYTLEIGYQNFYGEKLENVVVSLDVFDEKDNQGFDYENQFSKPKCKPQRKFRMLILQDE